MMKNIKKAILPCAVAGLLILGGCGQAATTGTTAAETASQVTTAQTTQAAQETTTAGTEVITEVTATSEEITESEWFSNRDLAGTYDESEAKEIVLDGESVTISEEGVYIISGEISDGQIIVDVDKTEKVQLVLDGVEISCSDSACIYVKSADKVFITLADGSTNILETTGEFEADGDTNVDGVIFSKDDLTINGTGSLQISTEYGHGIVGKDDLTITGGIIDVESSSSAISANDVLAITNADIAIISDKDGIKADNEDTTLGIIYIESGSFSIVSGGDAFSASGELIIEDGDFDLTTGGGSDNGADHQDIMNHFGGMFGGQSYTLDDVDADDAESDSYKGLKADGDITINGGNFNMDCADDCIHTDSDVVINAGSFYLVSGDDGIHADGMVTINGGDFDITAWEGIEGTYILINDGTVTVDGQDDGINATNKSSAYETAIEINGGYITVTMASGDTDGLDSNGNIYINGGTVDVTCQSPFDYDGYAEYNGGTLITNGTQTDTITNQMMGGGGMGGMGGPRR